MNKPTPTAEREHPLVQALLAAGILVRDGKQIMLVLKEMRP